MSIPSDQYELYAEFGMTAEKAQALEVAAGNIVLSFYTLFVDSDQISSEEREFFRGLLDDINQVTLGRVLKTVKCLGTFDESLLAIIDEGLRQRNYLTHHFFRTHNFAIHHASGRAVMVEELRGIRSKLDQADFVLNAVSEFLDEHAGREGVSGSDAQKLMSQLMAEGRRVPI